MCPIRKQIFLVQYFAQFSYKKKLDNVVGIVRIQLRKCIEYVLSTKTINNCQVECSANVVID
jgi:hypothetical protein